MNKKHSRELRNRLLVHLLSLALEARLEVLDPLQDLLVREAVKRPCERVHPARKREVGVRERRADEVRRVGGPAH